MMSVQIQSATVMMIILVVDTVTVHLNIQVNMANAENSKILTDQSKDRGMQIRVVGKIVGNISN